MGEDSAIEEWAVVYYHELKTAGRQPYFIDLQRLGYFQNLYNVMDFTLTQDAVSDSVVCANQLLSALSTNPSRALLEQKRLLKCFRAKINRKMILLKTPNI